MPDFGQSSAAWRPAHLPQVWRAACRSRGWETMLHIYIHGPFPRPDGAEEGHNSQTIHVSATSTQTHCHHSPGSHPAPTCQTH